MATIRKEFSLNVGAKRAWNALRDFGAVHERLVPGFVLDTKLDGDVAPYISSQMDLGVAAMQRNFGG
jgi:hypothetical protein